MRKHHADEQFLARRNVRQLPEAIARLQTRLEELAADMETARAREDDPVTINGVSCAREKVLPALVARLDALPDEVRESRRFMLGQMRGLGFGIMKHRFGAPEVFLNGQGERRSQLSRESQGPRAVFNALERLFASYGSRCEECRSELALSEVKLRDFEARLGGAFPHERYIGELSALRDELKVALSATPQEGAGLKTRTPGELSDFIKDLTETHAVEASPMKRPGLAARSERPVTARIRKTVEVAPADDQAAGPPEGQGSEVMAAPTREAPAFTPLASKPVAQTPRELRRRRYQKWMF